MLLERTDTRKAQGMAVDLVIEIDNTPGALSRVATAISDAGVNIAAATCTGPGKQAELHILVPHAGAVKHLLGISQLAVSREREVVVVDVEDRPGVLASTSISSTSPRRIASSSAQPILVHSRPRSTSRADGRPPGQTRVATDHHHHDQFRRDRQPLGLAAGGLGPRPPLVTHCSTPASMWSSSAPRR